MIQFIQIVSNFLTGLGAAVLLPIILTVIGLIFGLGFKKSAISGLTLGAGFVLLNLVLGYFVTALSDPVKQLISIWGIQKSMVDVGWGVSSAIAFSTNIGAVIIPVIILTNLIMIALRLTKTLNVDIWNFWSLAFTGSMVYKISGYFLLGIIAAMIHAILGLVIADRTAERVQEEFGIPGVSIPQGFAITTVPIIIIVNKILDRIPVVKDINWTEKNIRERFGFIGNPLILGSILGIIIGLFAGYYKDIPKLLNLGISIGAVLLIIPKVVGLFMEALSPIANAAQTFMKDKFKNRDLYIGMDSAILVGQPVTLSASIILIPLVLVLALILPGNKVLPLADLAALAYFIAFVPAFSKGNLFRSIVCGAVILTVVMYVCTGFGSGLTQLGVNVGYSIPKDANDITALSGGNWITFLLYKIGSFF